MKYFVVSDVHSFYDELMLALEDSGFDINNPEHVFVCCGDLLDRGTKPLECLKFVMSIPKERRILIRGNHEDLLEECLARGEFLNHDIHNGTCGTVFTLGNDYMMSFGTDKDTFYDTFQLCERHPMLKEYLSECIDYKEVGDYIFVHGWLPVKKKFDGGRIKVMLETDWKTGDWEAARWVNGMKAWNEGNKIDGKTIVCGHFHSSWGHTYLHADGTEFGPNMKTTPFIDKGIIALDACTAYSGRINCVILEVK